MDLYQGNQKWLCVDFFLQYMPPEIIKKGKNPKLGDTTGAWEWICNSKIFFFFWFLESFFCLSLTLKQILNWVRFSFTFLLMVNFYGWILCKIYISVCKKLSTRKFCCLDFINKNISEINSIQTIFENDFI